VAGGSGLFTNAGTLRKTTATTFTIGGGPGFSFVNSGTIEITEGTLALTSGDATQSAGSINLLGGALTVPGALILNGGTLGGTGTITGNVTNTAGTVSPGSAGVHASLAITGNFTQSAGGVLELNLAGNTPGTQFDQLLVTGAASLGGTLALVQTDSFTPADAATFDVVRFGSVSGNFTSTAVSGYGVGVGASSAIVGTAARVTFVVAATATWLGGTGAWNVSSN
jgi:hypothetical protein